MAPHSDLVVISSKQSACRALRLDILGLRCRLVPLQLSQLIPPHALVQLAGCRCCGRLIGQASKLQFEKELPTVRTRDKITLRLAPVFSPSPHQSVKKVAHFFCQNRINPTTNFLEHRIRRPLRTPNLYNRRLLLFAAYAYVQ